MRKETISDLSVRLNNLTQQVETLQTKIRPAINDSFRTAFNLATRDPQHAAETLQSYATSPDTVVQIAELALKSQLVHPTHGRSLRLVAVLILRNILAVHPNHPKALCLLGETFLPSLHYGKNDEYVPRSVLKECLRLFDRAANHGSSLGLFLKGRCLLSMEPIHRDPVQASLGRQCVKAAVQQNCPRALVFLAHRYEYPELDRTVSFATDLPRGKAAREKIILDIYMRAANLGDPNALNDIGTSYAEGYGGLQCDFDKAVQYYLRAINKGSLHAFDNLATHYETGMGGRHTDRINLQKALYYYRQGVRRRCPKCTYNLAVAHEEGMSGALQRDNLRAEKYYRHSILLADALHDITSAARAIKDLSALYLTRIKLNHPESDIVSVAKRRLYRWTVGERYISTTLMPKLNKAIAQAAKGRSTALSKIVGDMNSKLITTHVKELEDRIKHGALPDDVIMLNHVLGQGRNSGELDVDGRRRKRPVVPATRLKKKRRTIS